MAPLGFKVAELKSCGSWFFNSAIFISHRFIATAGSPYVYVKGKTADRPTSRSAHACFFLSGPRKHDRLPKHVFFGLLECEENIFGTPSVWGDIVSFPKFDHEIFLLIFDSDFRIMSLYVSLYVSLHP